MYLMYHTFDTFYRVTTLQICDEEVDLATVVYEYL